MTCTCLRTTSTQQTESVTTNWRLALLLFCLVGAYKNPSSNSSSSGGGGGGAAAAAAAVAGSIQLQLYYLYSRSRHK